MNSGINCWDPSSIQRTRQQMPVISDALAIHQILQRIARSDTICIYCRLQVVKVKKTTKKTYYVFRTAESPYLFCSSPEVRIDILKFQMYVFIYLFM